MAQSAFVRGCHPQAGITQGSGSKSPMCMTTSPQEKPFAAGEPLHTYGRSQPNSNLLALKPVSPQALHPKLNPQQPCHASLVPECLCQHAKGGGRAGMKGLLTNRLFSRPSPKTSSYTYIQCPSAPAMLMEKEAKILAALTNPVSSMRVFFRCKVLPCVTSPTIRMTFPTLPAPKKSARINQVGTQNT